MAKVRSDVADVVRVAAVEVDAELGHENGEATRVAKAEAAETRAKDREAAKRAKAKTTRMTFGGEFERRSMRLVRNGMP